MKPNALIAVILDRLLARDLMPGTVVVSARGMEPVVAWPHPHWHWSVCGSCGGWTRPGLPCSGCGWPLGAITPEQAAAAGVGTDEPQG